MACISAAGPSSRRFLHRLWRVRRRRRWCCHRPVIAHLLHLPLYIHVLLNIESKRTATSMATTTPALDRLSPAQVQPAENLLHDRTTALALEEYKKKDPTKVVVRFKSIGSAPIMKNNVFKATAGHKFQAVIMFLRQQLGMKKEDSLFTYINAAFAPAPDDTVGSLYKSFGTEGHLIVNYRCGRTPSSHLSMC
ncbi:hypothetical protein C352_03549 [Cryptococcus neoformans CHC193]|nr:hypothetical protein C352_03549 [Cryptococcus neoformans var. grubii CHC193]